MLLVHQLRLFCSRSYRNISDLSTTKTQTVWRTPSSWRLQILLIQISHTVCFSQLLSLALEQLQSQANTYLLAQSIVNKHSKYFLFLYYLKTSATAIKVRWSTKTDNLVQYSFFFGYPKIKVTFAGYQTQINSTLKNWLLK